jgi:hypothetical protein
MGGGLLLAPKLIKGHWVAPEFFFLETNVDKL